MGRPIWHAVVKGYRLEVIPRGGGLYAYTFATYRERDVALKLLFQLVEELPDHDFVLWRQLEDVEASSPTVDKLEGEV